MSQRRLNAPGWCKALTLTERLPALRTVHVKSLDTKINEILADRRFHRWRSQSPFVTNEYFDQRLAMDSLTEDELRFLLGESTDSLYARHTDPPAWLQELLTAFTQPTSIAPITLPEVFHTQDDAKFLEAIAPLLHHGRNRMREYIQELVLSYKNLPFDPQTILDIAFASLPGQLLTMLHRTMVLELHAARLEDRLAGLTPQERFHDFVQQMCTPSVMLAFLEEYPVLARQLMMCIDNWIRSNFEFLQRLCIDWEAICATFGSKGNPGLVTHIDNNMGDRHKGGRSVLIPQFESGLKVVYKPRSLAVDVHFQELLAWINDHGDHAPFRTLEILDRGHYGWVEFVIAEGCISEDEVRHFYERQGGYLALLYALEATDLHHENLIAAGEHPVLIDLESLFQPRVGGIDIKQSDALASITIGHSVLRVGLLPNRVWGNDIYEGIDLSGLGAVAGQLTPNEIPYWEGGGTDDMRLAGKRMPILAGQHRPVRNGADVSALNYVDAITTGFTSIYRLLLHHRDELLSNNGPLASFYTDEVRIIVRQTQTYGLLLSTGFHPHVLRNALDRDRHFDWLWAGIEYRPHLARVIAAEHADLACGDIPMFTTRPDSRNIWSSTNEQFVNFFDEPGMVLVRRRIQQLSDVDLTQQLWFTRAALATLSPETMQYPTYRLVEPKTPIDRSQLLAAARAVGNRLEALALRGEKDVSWLGLTSTKGTDWRLTQLGLDLYSGLPGITLFLAYLGAILHEERYTSLAQAALTTIRRQTEQGKGYFKVVSGFAGWGGVIYTLTHLSTLWNQPALLQEAEALVEVLPPLIEKDEHIDVLGGVAGCIASLTSLYHCASSSQALAVAIQCGDHLLARAQRMEQGIGWSTPIAPRPLAGFAHGAGGIAWALLELATLSGEPRFREAAQAAVEYERTLFVPEVGNWRDLRDLETLRLAKELDQGTFITAWCHGATGIGLARVRMLPYLNDSVMYEEIDVALKTTYTEGFGLNHSLCHGDLGNLELLVQASEVLNEPYWRAEADRLTAMILDSVGREGWICGVPLGIETPGLLTGLAGIGYGFLRLAEPAVVPSVLLLAPPCIK